MTAMARMLMSMADAYAETQLQHCDKDSERAHCSTRDISMVIVDFDDMGPPSSL